MHRVCKERAMRYAPFKITEVDDSTMCWSRLGKRKILYLLLPSLRARLSVASLPRRWFRDNAVPLARQHRGSFERCVRGDDDCEQRTPCELVQGGRDSTSFDADARQHVRDSRFSR